MCNANIVGLVKHQAAREIYQASEECVWEEIENGSEIIHVRRRIQEGGVDRSSTYRLETVAAPGRQQCNIGECCLCRTPKRISE